MTREFKFHQTTESYCIPFFIPNQTVLFRSHSQIQRHPVLTTSVWLNRPGTRKLREHGMNRLTETSNSIERGLFELSLDFRPRF